MGTQKWPVTIDDWSPDTANKSLHSLYELSIAAAQARIDWYDEKSKLKGRQSRLLRMGAIVAGTVGTLLPLVHAALGISGTAWGNLGPWGYVALAIAGAFLLGDRAFGTSSSWMRFRRAQTRLTKLVVQFQTDWATQMSEFDHSHEPAVARQELLNLQKEFAIAIEEIVEDEMEAWIAEFRTSLAELSRAYRKEESSSETVARSKRGQPLQKDDTGNS